MYLEGAGYISVVHCLGDYRFKNNPDLGRDDQAVIAVAAVHHELRKPSDEFVLLASDGIWNGKKFVDDPTSYYGQRCVTYTSQEICEFVQAERASGVPPAKLVENLNKKCLESADNMTAIVIWLSAAPASCPQRSPDLHKS
eukprot:m.183176 g.183176  ORF g.183176 m.183176 type:complete len:141 (-) comp9999_c0_seq3:43-465(-)